MFICIPIILDWWASLGVSGHVSTDAEGVFVLSSLRNNINFLISLPNDNMLSDYK